ncbi:Fusaric acid resistance protein fusE [Granulibacter bethesdensis]|uniref:efflux RND transporter periplasmic adaptor subunit n=1 Tax=Granulibacter bethesdensis TaxID=364410 RepID=UPI00090A22E4|nr:HlyD family secretion protein [Granulibacter bethesdensis]APH57962.1 Fusaric acid resistance protein fusE [Granulibacter bethesdensis]
MRFLKYAVRVMITLIVVAVALWLGVMLWHVYMLAPWTRDGRVRAYVVSIGPEVPGYVTRVTVRDNQFVHKGDMLFELDPIRFRLAIAQAQAALDSAQARYRNNQADVKRRQGLTGIVSPEEQEQFRTTAAVSAAAVEKAKADLDVAKLNLERSVLYAPVNGYVTNLQLRVGDYATAGHALLAMIDAESFYIYGYFEETKLHHIKAGDPARIKLMGYSELLSGHVDSIGRGINDKNQSLDNLGLPDVNPVFTWVRLAQRIPVRIHIDKVPKSITLAAGMTCSVALGNEADQDYSAAGRAVQWLEDHL